MRLTPVLCLVAATGCATTFDASAPDGAVNASNRFGLELYGHVRKEQGNFICSPVSASVALAMTAGGARGQTLEEMAKVLHLDSRKLPESHASFAGLLSGLNQRDGQDGIQLQVAGQIWGDKAVPFRREFLALLEGQYRAPMQTVDFLHDPEAARAAINAWGAARTHGRIAESLPPGAIDQNVELVLTSAVYFKGAWVHPFDPEETTELPFSISPGRQIPARTMRLGADLRHATVGGAALVELPYEGGVSMVVILPQSVGGLDEVETKLATSYADWVGALRDKRVELQLPVWKVSAELSLREVLAALGMPTAFGETADFGGLEAHPAGARSLSIHSVLQKAFAEVDETGTEAAAVTSVTVTAKKGGPKLERVEFHADHPFIYVIRDDRTGAILFVGRVVEPGA